MSQTDLSGPLVVTGNATVGGDLTVSGGGVTVTPASGVTSLGPLVKLAETVAYSAFTDGGSTAGTYDLTVGTIPVGALFLGACITALTGFAGDTSAVITVGDGTDADRYNTGTPDVFSDVATGIELGLPSGDRYHPAAKTVKLTVTTNSDFTSVSAGSITIELYYLT